MLQRPKKNGPLVIARKKTEQNHDEKNRTVWEVERSGPLDWQVVNLKSIAVKK